MYLTNKIGWINFIVTSLPHVWKKYFASVNISNRKFTPVLQPWRVRLRKSGSQSKRSAKPRANAISRVSYCYQSTAGCTCHRTIYFVLRNEKNPCVNQLKPWLEVCGIGEPFQPVPTLENSFRPTDPMAGSRCSCCALAYEVFATVYLI